MNHHNHRESRIRHWASCGENPTLAHFRHFSSLYFTLAHFRHFSSLFTNLPSTFVESSLQITYFYAKQTQFPKSQMNANLYNTTDYERKRNWRLGENKPHSNPNKPTHRKAQMNINSIITKDYRKNDAFAVQKNKPNTNPNKANLPEGKIDAKCVVTKDYEEQCG